MLEVHNLLTLEYMVKMMIAILLYLARRLPAVVAAVALGTGAIASLPARAAGSPAPPMPCSDSGSGHGVAITSCSFVLEPSPAGNVNYFVNVTLKYTAPAGATAVRFRCALRNGSSAVSQYGVLRSSGSTLKFVSPFASTGSAVQSVSCYVDAA